MRKLAKSVFDPLGLGEMVRQAFVDINLVGERALFFFKGRPTPSDAIFLAGSSRSGTTWLDHTLCSVPGTQEIFEPLSPVWNSDVRELTGWGETGRFRTGVYSYYLRPDMVDPKWVEFFNNILTGQTRNYWTDVERTSYFPSRFLIKEVRANLMLGYVYDHFQPKIIFLARHPCAVTYSRLRNGFAADVKDILEQEELVENYLRPWIREIEQEKDNLGALAVWWAVENMVARHELSNRPHFFVKYESMVNEPRATINGLIEWLNVPSFPEHGFKKINQPSRSSPGQADIISPFEWETGFSDEEKKRILTWARRFEIPWY